MRNDYIFINNSNPMAKMITTNDSILFLMCVLLVIIDQYLEKKKNTSVKSN